MASFNCQTCWTTGERIMKTVWLYCLENIDHVRHNFCTVILSMCPCYKRCLRNVFTYCSRRSEGRSGHKGRPIIRCPKCDLRLQLNHWLYGRLRCLAGEEEEGGEKKTSRRIHYSNDLNLSKITQEFAQSIVRHFCANYKKNNKSESVKNCRMMFNRLEWYCLWAGVANISSLFCHRNAVFLQRR